MVEVFVKVWREGATSLSPVYEEYAGDYEMNLSVNEDRTKVVSDTYVTLTSMQGDVYKKKVSDFPERSEVLENIDRLLDEHLSRFVSHMDKTLGEGHMFKVGERIEKW